MIVPGDSDAGFLVRGRTLRRITLAADVLVLLFVALYISGSVAFDLQAAINAAPAGATVTIPAGTYTFSSTVNLTSGVSLKGAGIDQTILTMPSQSGPTGLLQADGAQGITISDMTLSSPSASGYVFAIWISDYSDVTIERVKVENCHYALKADTSGSNLTVRDFTARASGQMYISNLTIGLFERLDLEMVTQRVSDTSFHPLYISENSHHLRFYDVRAIGGSGHAVQIWGGVATDILFDGLYVKNDYAIVIGGGADGVTFRNVTAIQTGKDDFACVQLDYPKNILMENFTASGGWALVGTYQDNSPQPENITFRNGTYTGRQLAVDWDQPIINLVFENVTLASGT